MSEVSLGPLGYPLKQMFWCGKHLESDWAIGYHFGIAMFPTVLDRENSHRDGAVGIEANKGTCRRFYVFEDNERLLIDSELGDDALRDTRVKHHSVTPDKCHGPNVFGRALEVVGYGLLTSSNDFHKAPGAR